jgi:hypothetical protein
MTRSRSTHDQPFTVKQTQTKLPELQVFDHQTDAIQQLGNFNRKESRSVQIAVLPLHQQRPGPLVTGSAAARYRERAADVKAHKHCVWRSPKHRRPERHRRRSGCRQVCLSLIGSPHGPACPSRRLGTCACSHCNQTSGYVPGRSETSFHDLQTPAQR